MLAETLPGGSHATGLAWLMRQAISEARDMSHHPSSAELAAFRRSIAGIVAPSIYTTGAVCDDHPGGPESGYGCARAWPHERERGIGYREIGGIRISQYARASYRDAGIARREASAMRSRAYARMDTLTCQQHGVRTWYVDGARLCWDCGRSCPVVDIPFWDDEQPRSPLPIAYRNPIGIAAD